VESQEVLREELAEHFAACEEVQEFFRARRGEQRKPTPAHHAVTWTTARSYRTFLAVVHLCECGYGQQAAMLNRTLFEDMISAHWAVKHPETAAKRLIEHDQYTATLRAEMYTEHGIPFAPPNLPRYTDEERERLNKRYRDGSSAWTGKTLPRMVKAVAPMWEEVDRRLLHQMHDIAHRAHNTLLHHSATSLSLGVTVSKDDEGNDTVTFNVGPSCVFVQSSLSFALWTFPNTFSLLLDVKALAGLNELMSKHSHLYSTARASTATE
jgi:hypothetical protein